jgi:AcrR family transcriptional regulator
MKPTRASTNLSTATLRSGDPAILGAALAVLAEHGYDATTMNDIATRAGVGKAAIYRRWSSKAALITDALVSWRPKLLAGGAPETGSLAGDLDSLAERAKPNDNHPISNDLVLRVANLISNDLLLRFAVESTRHPDLVSALDDLMLCAGRRALSDILAQAADRGEIAATRDWSLVADVILAMSLLRVIRGQTVDAAFVRQVIEILILPAVRTACRPRNRAEASTVRPAAGRSTGDGAASRRAGSRGIGGPGHTAADHPD